MVTTNFAKGIELFLTVRDRCNHFLLRHDYCTSFFLIGSSARVLGYPRFDTFHLISNVNLWNILKQWNNDGFTYQSPCLHSFFLFVVWLLFYFFLSFIFRKQRNSRGAGFYLPIFIFRYVII